MPSIFSKCYRLCNTCLNTCSQLLHLSPEQQKKKNVSNTMKPTIVIVPGAWQNIECYESLRDTFASLGYDSICRSPPSTTLTHGDTDLAADVTFMRNSVLQPLLAEGKDVVLLMHSFGGVYGGASVRGLSRTERAAQGLKGGVVALVYMAAACVPSGMTTLERMGVGEDLLPWVSLDVCSSYPSLAHVDVVGLLILGFQYPIEIYWPPHNSGSNPTDVPQFTRRRGGTLGARHAAPGYQADAEHRRICAL